MAFIYCIENTINQKRYVGETTYSIKTRWNEHCRMAKIEQAQHRPLYRAFNKYGIENFIIYKLEECANEDRWAREQYWIKKLNTFTEGYNATLGGDGSPRIPFQEDEFLSFYEARWTPQQIAEYYNCCVDSVGKFAHSIGISFRGHSQRTPVEAHVNGVFIKSFYSASDAARWLISEGYSKAKLESIAINIGRCCKGVRLQCCGFNWRYTSA